MKIFQSIAVATVALALSASAASAQWIHTQGEDDPFAGGAQHMAMTASEMGEILGFRCTNATDLSLLYVSIEKPQAEHRALLGVIPLQLLVIVDNEPVRSFEAKIDTTPDGDRYRVTAVGKDLSALARATAGAKRRFAVAVQMNGERMYSAAVGVRGSTNAINKLARGCNLP